MIVNFIMDHCDKIERPKQGGQAKSRNYKSLLFFKGVLQSALLNQTIMKLLKTVFQMNELDGLDTKTWLNGKWVVVPQQIYNFFNYVTY